ncbi:DUF4367 domain-containing protein [Haladaptatus salinisoli]|uniref:DUF4367 domain-containing protein n=1 Tax=Haladaptatus salinisoli TaxID=2884876 RepID=UPI001D0AEF47|nr:DUF4367 domain-containing protein [Haladaptatus salinisoli]
MERVYGTMPSDDQSPDHEGYTSIEAADRDVPFTLGRPTALPRGYRRIQLHVQEASELGHFGMSAWMVFESESGDPSEHLAVTARAADDPSVPGHPYGVDEEVMVNGCPGTYAMTDHLEVSPAPPEDEFVEVDSLPPGASVAPPERQKGVLEFIDESGTYYYLIGPFDRDELVRIAESID